LLLLLLTMIRALLLLAGVANAAAASGLTMNTFGNSAMHGAPLKSSTISSLSKLSVPLSATTGSAEITGTLTFKDASLYSFQCDFSPGQMAFVWIRDHLICHTHPVRRGLLLLLMLLLLMLTVVLLLLLLLTLSAVAGSLRQHSEQHGRLP